MTEVSANGSVESRTEVDPVLGTVDSVRNDTKRCAVAQLPSEPDQRTHRSTATANRSTRRLPEGDYTRLVESSRAIVNAIVPPGAVIAVISKGDSQLVRFKKRIGWHFPQDFEGKYAGYHPADSDMAIEELEKLRAKGANFLLLPSTAFWWLDHYRAFSHHLTVTSRRAWSDENCVIYQISEGTYRAPRLRLKFPGARAATNVAKAASVSEALRLAIDSRIPESLIVGEGGAFYIAGWCYHPTARISQLEVVCNGQACSLKAWGISRQDVLAAHYPSHDRTRKSLYSGFWGLVPVTKVQQVTDAQVVLRAKLRNGGTCETVVGHIKLEPAPAQKARVEHGSSSPCVAICMATYNPPLELFKRQIESIRRQTFPNWTCLITDDGSRPDLFEKAHRIIGNDRRFRVYRAQSGVGFYKNFERCLSLAPESAKYIALSDHDDNWHADKLESLLDGFDSETTLAYSDMRIVEASGRELSPTYWTTRPNNFTNFASLLMANTITGGASLFRRDLLELILPFPERIGEAYHDHWIGAVALATGNIRYVDRPLYDYVQHGGNVIGHYAPQKPMAFLADGVSVRHPAQLARETLRYWERVYFGDLLRIQLITEVIKLRCGNRMSSHKLQELGRIQNLGSSWNNLLWLARRALAGRNRITETVNAERPLLGAALWRHSAGYRWRQRIAGPAGHNPVPTSSNNGGVQQNLSSVETIREKIAPLSLKISGAAPRRLNLLIPTIDLKYFFGGYITKFNLARQLAQDGLKVRMVLVDHCDWQPEQWRTQLKRFRGLEHFFEHVEVVYAYDRTRPLEVNPEDVFMATTWWTAHIAHAATKAVGASSFIYLIQEYEPFTFAMGSFSALANQSYEFPHYAVFSTEFLRTYFRENRLGVFAEKPIDGAARSIAFENAITDVGEVTTEDLAHRGCKRLLYYARPEMHAARNMFEIGILALAEAIEAGYFDDKWEFYGIGSLGSAQKLALPKGRSLILLPRDNQECYRDILRAHDVGLALMYTPHPSLVPIEMASAGMLVVTTTYANKTQTELAKISPNLIAAHPSIERIKLGLKEATLRVHDYEARVKGSHVEWATTWESAFNPQVKTKIMEFMQASRSCRMICQLTE